MQITEPGEYLTRDGRTATVTEITPYYIFRVFGKLGRSDERWTVEGRLFVKHESGGDIVGKAAS